MTKRLIVAFTMLFTAFCGYAQITSRANTAWNLTSTWSGGVVPPAGSTVVVNHNVSIPSGVSTNSLSSLTISSGRSLTVSTGGTLNISGTSTVTGTLNMNGGACSGGSYSISVGGTLNLNSGTFSIGSLTISGGFNFNSTDMSITTLTINSGGSFNLGNAGVVNLTGNFVNNGSFSDALGGGTISFDGTSQSISTSSTTELVNVNISSGAAVALASGATVNLNGVLTLNGTGSFDADASDGTGTFTIISQSDDPIADGSIAAIPGGASFTGNVTAQRYMSIEGPNNTRIYRWISSPLSNTPVSDIQNTIPVTGSFTGASTGCSGCTTNQSMFAYDESIITDTNGNSVANLHDGYIDFPSSSNAETLQPGRGYSIYVRGNVDPVASSGSALWSTTGTINSGTVNYPVTFTSSGIAADDGWNLVGNPYPSTIDWDASGWTRTNIADAIYTPDFGSNPQVFATYIGGVGLNNGSRYIAMGQAFWVQATSSSPFLSSTEDVKAVDPSTIFFRVAQPTNILRITLRNGSVRDESVIRIRSDATPQFDPNADARKMSNIGTFNLSSFTSDGVKLAINSIAPVAECSSTINLDVSNVVAGSYQLDFSQLETFTDVLDISLIDSYTGTTTNVKNTPSYSFSVTSDSTTYGKNRFSIVFEKPHAPASITISENMLSSNYSSGNTWYFNSELISGATGEQLAANESGVYTLVVDFDGCIITDEVEMVITSANYIKEAGYISIYPIPASEEVNVSVRSDNAVFIELYNNVGVKINAQELLADDKGFRSGSLSFRGNSSGIYFLKIYDDQVVNFKKVIKK